MHGSCHGSCSPTTVLGVHKIATYGRFSMLKKQDFNSVPGFHNPTFWSGPSLKTLLITRLPMNIPSSPPWNAFALLDLSLFNSLETTGKSNWRKKLSTNSTWSSFLLSLFFSFLFYFLNLFLDNCVYKYSPNCINILFWIIINLDPTIIKR